MKYRWFNFGDFVNRFINVDSLGTATLRPILNVLSSGCYGSNLIPYQDMMKILLIINDKKICKLDILRTLQKRQKGKSIYRYKNLFNKNLQYNGWLKAKMYTNQQVPYISFSSTSLAIKSKHNAPNSPIIEHTEIWA